jgi:hypothetical protein
MRCTGGNAGYADPARGDTFAYAARRVGDFDHVDAPADAVNAAIDGRRFSLERIIAAF